MSWGGYRVGSGRPPGAKPGESLARIVIPEGGVTPLEYMLAVMNDPGADQSRKDRMAIAAAPYVHARISDPGKKEASKKEPGEKEKAVVAAETAAGGTDWVNLLP